ncbi:MAG: hypothetical protein ACI9F9_002399, partial [Candidatus Paceibacteria bacterium]
MTGSQEYDMHQLTLTLGLLAIMNVGLAGASQQPEESQRRVPKPSTVAPEEELQERKMAPVPGVLNLARSAVDVVINNGFATTTIEQVLDNPTDLVLEAIWAFPLPEEASLSELSLWIDEVVVVGEVVEKETARRIYEEEKSA